MIPERWRAIDELFHAAAPLAAPQREQFLREACADDTALRAEVDSLLVHHERPLPWLGEPVIDARRAAWEREALPDPVLGRRLGPYRLDARVATGGTGTVYRASRQDGEFEQTVAVKMLHPFCHDTSIAERFRVESRTLAALVHDHIARVFDAGVTEDGTPYIVLEYLEGGTIDAYCDRHRASVERRLELFEHVARAVHFAHQNLVVHRDIKPTNVLMTPAGTPKLLDFGIAKLLAAGEPAAGGRTMVMTPFYASPEQLRGEPVTTATDVYSLGVLLYELLTGRRPYGAATDSTVHVQRVIGAADSVRPSVAVLTTPAAGGDGPAAVAARRRLSPRGLRRRLRGDLDVVIAMAMHAEPARRYASAEGLADDVRRHLRGQPVLARTDSFAYRVRKFVARNRLATAAAVTAVGAVVVGAAATVWQAERAAAERDHARIEADSSAQIVDILSDAFLISAPRRSAEQLERITALLDRHLFRIRRRYAGQPHERANLLDAVGRVFVELELHDRAAELLGEAMAIRERAFGSDSIEVALSHASLGLLAHRRNDLDAAVGHFRRAVELQQRLPVGVHTDIPRALNDFAVVLRLTGEVDRAYALHERALSLRRDDHGGEHLTVATSLNNLAAIHLQRGERERAHELLQQAISMRRADLGDHHPLVAQSLNNLATVEYRLGRPQAAIATMREAVALYREMPEVETQALVRALVNLAGMLRQSGDSEGARAAAGEGLELLRTRRFAGDHPLFADALGVAAEATQACGEGPRALELYAEALAAMRRAHPDGHPSLALLLCNYGMLTLAEGEPARAEPLLRDAVAAIASTTPVRADILVGAECALGACLVAQARHADAERVLLAASDRIGDVDSPERQQVRRQLHRLYTAWGRPERAADYGR